MDNLQQKIEVLLAQFAMVGATAKKLQVSSLLQFLGLRNCKMDAQMLKDRKKQVVREMDLPKLEQKQNFSNIRPRHPPRYRFFLCTLHTCLPSPNTLCFSQFALKIAQHKMGKKMTQRGTFKGDLEIKRPFLDYMHSIRVVATQKWPIASRGKRLELDSYPTNQDSYAKWPKCH